MDYFDMHCHLDFASNGADAVSEMDARDIGAFAVSVLPVAGALNSLEGSAQAVQSAGSQEEGASLVRWGVGLHPWWIARGLADDSTVDALVEMVGRTTFVGEVGLDFGKTHGQSEENRARQIEAFTRIAHACAQHGGKVLSIHAVASAPDVWRILTDAGVVDTCTCIFHWYSGDSETLHAAVKAGCLFSVGSFMLETKRGREYARQIPAGQLLFETDYPALGSPYDVGAMQQQLAQTCALVAAARAVPADELAETVAATSRSLLAR